MKPIISIKKNNVSEKEVCGTTSMLHELVVEFDDRRDSAPKYEMIDITYYKEKLRCLLFELVTRTLFEGIERTSINVERTSDGKGFDYYYSYTSTVYDENVYGLYQVFNILQICTKRCDKGVEYTIYTENMSVLDVVTDFIKEYSE